MQEFRGSDDAILYELAYCSDADHVILYRIDSFAELWLDDQLREVVVLDHLESRRIRETFPGEWPSRREQLRAVSSSRSLESPGSAGG